MKFTCSHSNFGQVQSIGNTYACRTCHELLSNHFIKVINESLKNNIKIKSILANPQEIYNAFGIEVKRDRILNYMGYPIKLTERKYIS